MIQFIQSINGPMFLLYYAVLTFIIAYAVAVLSRRDGTDSFGAPDPGQFTPMELALLRNGIKGAVSFAMYALWKRKAVSYERKAKSLLVQSTAATINGMTTLERTLCKIFKDKKPYYDAFKGDNKAKIISALEQEAAKLEHEQMLPDEAIKMHRRKVLRVGLFVSLGIGATKLMLGIANDKPVIFLFVLMGVSAFVIYAAWADNNTPTQLGRNLLADARTRYDWVKGPSADRHGASNNDLEFGLALFGISAMADIAFDASDADGPELFDTDVKYSSGGGCGGGCSDGGGSDGGCGGGCGGCGD